MADREMSMKEYLRQLPDNHLARRQFQNVVQAWAELQQWLNGMDKPPGFVTRARDHLANALDDSLDPGEPMAEPDGPALDPKDE